MNENTMLEANRPETFARIMKAYLDDSVMLSQHEKHIYERLVYADELLKNPTMPSREHRAKELAKVFGISVRQARNDLAKAEQLFNSLEIIDPKTGARVILAQIDTLISMCLKTPFDGYISEISKLLKLKKEVYEDLVGNSQIDADLIQQNQFVFHFGADAARSLGLEKKVTRNEALNLIRQFNLSKEQEQKILDDAEFVELNEDGKE